MKHYHKYTRLHFSTGTIYYKCAIDGCTHFILAKLLEGRFAACWRCGAVFTVLKKHLRNKRLHCEDCTKEWAGKIKSNKTITFETENLLKEIGMET